MKQITDSLYQAYLKVREDWDNEEAYNSFAQEVREFLKEKYTKLDHAKLIVQLYKFHKEQK
jgi:nuclear transport factor 2 (NTF2) superfamily protein